VILLFPAYAYQMPLLVRRFFIRPEFHSPYISALTTFGTNPGGALAEIYRVFKRKKHRRPILPPAQRGKLRSPFRPPSGRNKTLAAGITKEQHRKNSAGYFAAKNKFPATVAALFYVRIISFQNQLDNAYK
jgi:hypothetical protein